ncbi:serine aminopeptidase domain-containing protein [Bacillus wiedmannii]|uniref:serine aminopeptidase domain-containing protein n=1 Tax=Bacillus wiedmannii TaxID=1890302 RepID=UPI001D0E44B9|nr:alpha/beta hydrolase [Bacillus wiedmannii]MCC2326985.1 alpha/beta hydrolase [Bacillus wiedmannii]
MFKFTKPIVASAIVISLAACGTTHEKPDESSQKQNVTQGTKSFDEKDLKMKSAAYLEQFQKNDFDQLYKNVTQEMTSKLPKEEFASKWKALISQLGPALDTESEVFNSKDKNGKVSITTVHRKNNLQTTFVYTKDGKVADVQTEMQPLIVKPEKGEKWEESSIKVGYNEKKLNGLLTLPKGIEKPPVAILLQGSGPNNMDSIIGTGLNRPFADIAHGLAEKGIASIRYDKRSYAYPKDVFDVETEYLKDAKEAVRLVKEDKRVDSNKIYLIGHSQGGLLGPKIAQDNPEIKGFVSMAGTLRRLEDVVLTQTTLRVEQDTKLSGERKKEEMENTKESVQKIKKLNTSDKKEVLLGYPASYWSSLNKINGASIAKNLDIPMFIIQGTTDFHVLEKVDYKLWQETLAGKDDVSFKLYPGLSHLFMPGGSADKFDGSIYNKPAHVDSQVIEDVSGWINAQH